MPFATTLSRMLFETKPMLVPLDQLLSLDGLLRRAACTPPLIRLWSMVVLVHPPAIWVLRQELEDRACNVVQFRLLYKELLHLSILESYKPRQTNALDRNSN